VQNILIFNGLGHFKIILPVYLKIIFETIKNITTTSFFVNGDLSQYLCLVIIDGFKLGTQVKLAAPKL
jgi:hypothetical protein